MITIIQPDVFWSDIILGAIALYCITIVRTEDKRWTAIFASLAIATWVGALYHGFINTTTRLNGDILWTITLFFFALTSALVVRAVVGKKWQRYIFIVLALYMLWAIYISEAFLWALIIQAASLLLYGAFIVKQHLTRRSSNSKMAVLFFALFFAIDVFAVYAQQTKQQFGLPMSHNTIFHVLEMPSLILLALSMKYVSKKK